MKKIFKIFAVVSVFAGLVSCVKYADYKTVPFASVDVSSAKITEPAVGEPAVTYKLPVHVYNATSDCAVSYEIKDITAKQGVDYTIIGGTGVLNFAKGVDTQEIEFSISGQPGTFTGDVNFQVILKEATNNVTLGSINTARITIADKDHPLVSLFGDYKFTSVQLDDETEQLTKYSWTMTMSQYEGNPYRIWINKVIVLQSWYASYLPNGGGKVYAEVSEDLKTISIPVPQDFNTSGVNLFGVPDEFFFYRCNQLDFQVEQTPIVFTLQEDGSYATSDDYGVNIESGLSDWFYYGMNAFSSVSPTTFIKK